MNENQLIFLISQPRSGSSLTQQLLLNSDAITSTPETWQMLSLISTYKKTNIGLNYNPKQTITNYLSYLNSLDNGLEDLKIEIKKLALSFYSKANTKDVYFLDKTPRYYHIIDELYELFPEAKFVFLVRNPLAVFSSILDHNFKGDFVRFLASNDRINDLFLAPQCIQATIANKTNSVLIKYEDLIENTEKEMSKLFEYLSIETPEIISEYTLKDDFVDTVFLDTKSLNKHSNPSKNYVDAWKTTINSSQKKKLALEYLQKLKSSHHNYFDYNLDESIEAIINHKPTKNSIFNLKFDLLSQKEEALSITDVIKKRMFLKLQKI